MSEIRLCSTVLAFFFNVMCPNSSYFGYNAQLQMNDEKLPSCFHMRGFSGSIPQSIHDNVGVKVKQSLYRPGVAQRVPES